jgi:hypothetical protein
MPWTPCSCSLQHTLLYFSFLKLPEEDNFPTTEQINSNPCQTKIYANRSLLFWSSVCLSVCLSVRVSFYALLLYTHNRPVIKCSTEYTKPERSLRRGARLKIRSLLQKDSTRRGHFKGPRKRDLLTLEKLLLHRRGHRHRMAPPRVRRTRAHSKSWARGSFGRRRHRTPRWTFLVVIVVCLRPFCTSVMEFSPPH